MFQNKPKVKPCPNNGCDWAGQSSGLSKHKRKCLFKPTETSGPATSGPASSGPSTSLSSPVAPSVQLSVKLAIENPQTGSSDLYEGAYMVGLRPQHESTRAGNETLGETLSDSTLGSQPDNHEADPTFVPRSRN